MTEKNGFFDKRAQGWEANNYPPNVRRRLEALFPAFGVRENERILDIGTGPGVLVPYIQKAVGETGRIVAMDFSLEMVRVARSKLQSGTDLVLCGDVHHLPVATSSQDRVICFAAFPHFTDSGSALKEMARVLIAGGVLVVAHLMSRRELAAHHASHSAVARDVLPGPEKMREMFENAELGPPEIVDVPGRYIAIGSKPF